MESLGNDTLKSCLGCMFIIVALYFIFGDDKIKISHKRGSVFFLGITSGIMGGMFAMPGPPIVLYLIERLEDKRSYIATLQAFSVLINIFYTLFRCNAGFFSDNTISWLGIGLCGVVAGNRLGEILFRRIDSNTIKKIVYFMLLASGITAII